MSFMHFDATNAASVDTFLAEFTLTAGESGSAPNEHTGYDRIITTIGSIAPSADYDPASGNHTIGSLFTQNTNLVFRLDVEGIPNTNQTFREIEITGTFEQGTFTRITLRTQVNFYNPTDFGNTLWSFTGIPSLDMINGNVYDIVIRWDP